MTPPAEAHDRLDARALEEALAAAGIGGAAVRHLAAVDSTNAEMARWVAADPGPWAVVVAESQTAGRGRRGRAWSSPPVGNLYASVLTPEVASPVDWPRLPILAGVAAAEAVAAGGAAVGLKWPNDLQGRSGDKLGGILVEATGSGPPRAILGLGLNVNAGPDQLGPGATSLRRETGAGWDRALLLGRLLGALGRWWALFQAQGFGPVARAWEGRALWLEAPVRVMGEGGSQEGRLLGVDEWGRLRLATADGERRLAAGDVSLRAAD